MKQEIEQKKVNQIAKKLGLILVNQGQSFIKNAFHIKPIEILSGKIVEVLKSRGFNKNITLSDGRFYLIPFSQWKEIIEVDWTDKMKYVKEKRDCDNFAYSFSSRMSELFEINSAGIVWGYIYNKDTGKSIGGHLWNCIITSDFKMYFYEPMKDTYLEYNSGKIVMGKWRYEALSFRFF